MFSKISWYSSSYQLILVVMLLSWILAFLQKESYANGRFLFTTRHSSRTSRLRLTFGYQRQKKITSTLVDNYLLENYQHHLSVLWLISRVHSLSSTSGSKGIRDKNLFRILLLRNFLAMNISIGFIWFESTRIVIRELSTFTFAPTLVLESDSTTFYDAIFSQEKLWSF